MGQGGAWTALKNHSPANPSAPASPTIEAHGTVLQLVKKDEHHQYSSIVSRNGGSVEHAWQMQLTLGQQDLSFEHVVWRRVNKLEWFLGS